MTQLLPHRAWIAARPHMAFAYADEPSAALMAMMDASRAKADRLGLDGEHGIPLGGSLDDIGWTLPRFLRSVGMAGYIWDVAMFMHLKAFVFMNGREHRMGIGHDTPWTAAHGAAMRVRDLKGMPSAGFISFEGTRQRLVSTAPETPGLGGVSFTVTTIAGPDYDGPDTVVGDTDEQRMMSLRGLPGTCDQLQIVFWPESGTGGWHAAGPIGFMRGIDLDDDDALLMDLLEAATEEAESLPSPMPGVPAYPGHIRVANYRDIAAKTFAAIAWIRDHTGEERWRPEVPTYLRKRLEGDQVVKTERRLRERGYVREMVHPTIGAPDRRAPIRLASVRKRALRRIDEIDAAAVSVGAPIETARLSFIAAMSTMLTSLTGCAGWLVEAAPAERGRLSNAEHCASLVDARVRWSKTVVGTDVDLSPDRRAELASALDPVLLRLYATLDIDAPWSCTGAEEDEVLIAIAMIEAILNDAVAKVPRDATLGLMVERVSGIEHLIGAAADGRPRRPVRFANGLVLEAGEIIDLKTGRRMTGN